MIPLSVFVTTYNNSRTIGACLESVRWADEVLVLDSFSNDDTVEIARSLGCRVLQHEFLGYGRQKQLALDSTAHDWVLFLDADEALSSALVTEIKLLLSTGCSADGYTIPRQEQLFWTMCSPGTAMNRYLRLFNKHKTRFSEMPVHAAPHTEGELAELEHPFYHFGEPDIHTKVDKINGYSTGLVTDKVARGQRGRPIIMVIYPPLFFLKLYLLKRNFLNGWGGLITSVCGAFYVFMKYAKLYEYRQFERLGESAMPPRAPRHPRFLEAPEKPV
jgi:glycosyltransferase involved in cell wall biosynthesis